MKKSLRKTSSGARKKPKKDDVLRLIEKRRHPRFLLSGEQFRELRSGKIFPVYDLSLSGMSVRSDEKLWLEGSLIKGILNLHPDSIELTARVTGYYGDRAALKIELMSTYSRAVLHRILSPKRLGATLKLIREKLPVADLWYHGACNTDLLLKFDGIGIVSRVDIFVSNFYWTWSKTKGACATGVCQSIGRDRREDLLLGEEPVMLESIQLWPDWRPDLEKMSWAKDIIENSPMDHKFKAVLLKKVKSQA